MTQGETLFYLREIRTHWCTSNVSPEKLAELESAKLIERNAEPVPTVRLTSEGVRFKTLGQRPGSSSHLPTSRTAPPRRKFAQRKKVTPAQKLV